MPKGALRLRSEGQQISNSSFLFDLGSTEHLNIFEKSATYAWKSLEEPHFREMRNLAHRGRLKMLENNSIYYDETFEGFEYDWLCVDRHHRVAVVSTAGSGMLPKGYVESVHVGLMKSLLATLQIDEPVFMSTSSLGDALKRGSNGLYEIDESGAGEYVCVVKPKVPCIAEDNFFDALIDIGCLLKCDLSLLEIGSAIVTWGRPEAFKEY